jgi:hypothetical protein
MKRIISITILIFLVILPGSFDLQRMDYRTARNINVCKSLNGSALLYFIFVDSRETTPWTQYDIQSTIDSIRVAINWLHTQANKEDISLNIIADYYIGKEFISIKKNLPSGTIYNSITEPSLKKGISAINRWADGIAKVAGNNISIVDKDGIPEISNPKNKERLVAFLRDENNVESVALFFMLNNYYKSDISVQLNTTNTEDVEFAIVSYKYPSEIAHNFLHLYGAADMYETIYRRNDNKIRTLEKMFPDEIMQDPYGKDIWDLEISDYTKYLIGWTDELDPDYESLMTDKLINF